MQSYLWIALLRRHHMFIAAIAVLFVGRLYLRDAV
jgi:hypothetical protein